MYEELPLDRTCAWHVYGRSVPLVATRWHRITHQFTVHKQQFIFPHKKERKLNRSKSRAIIRLSFPNGVECSGELLLRQGFLEQPLLTVDLKTHRCPQEQGDFVPEHPPLTIPPRP